MLSEGTVSLSRYVGSSDDGHWPCNGFTSSTVPATGLRAVGASVRPACVSYSSLINPACDRLRFGPAVSGAVNPHAVQDYSDLASQQRSYRLRLRDPARIVHRRLEGNCHHRTNARHCISRRQTTSSRTIATTALGSVSYCAFKVARAESIASA